MSEALTIDPAEYWQLRFLCEAAQRAEAEAKLLLVRVNSEKQSLLDTLGAKYGFDSKAPQLRLDDDACTITPPEPPTPPAAAPVKEPNASE